MDFRCKHPIFILNTESGPAFADMNTKPKQNRARSELNKHDIYCPCHNTTRQNRYGNWKCSFLWIFFIHLGRFGAYVFMTVANFCRVPIFSLYTKFIVQHLLVPCLTTVVVLEILPTSLSLQFHPLEMIDFALDGKLVQDWS